MERTGSNSGFELFVLEEFLAVLRAGITASYGVFSVAHGVWTLFRQTSEFRFREKQVNKNMLLMFRAPARLAPLTNTAPVYIYFLAFKYSQKIKIKGKLAKINDVVSKIFT